jgi:hypothetical protein
VTEIPHEAGQVPVQDGYHVHLLVRSPRPIPIKALRLTLARLDPSVQLTDEADIVFRPEGQPESSLAVDGPGEIACDVDAAYSQTWDWPQAGHALDHAEAMFTVAETSTPALTDRFERLRRVNIVLRALLEHVPTVAVVWEPAQRLVDPLGSACPICSATSPESIR